MPSRKSDRPAALRWLRGDRDRSKTVSSSDKGNWGGGAIGYRVAEGEATMRDRSTGDDSRWFTARIVRRAGKGQPKIENHNRELVWRVFAELRWLQGDRANKDP